MGGSTPKVKAFLFCDQVIRSTDGKYTVVGIFQRIHSPQFPVFHARFGMYMCLGGMNGSYDLLIEFTDPGEGATLGRAELRGLKHNKPLQDFETGINLPGLQFPKEGTFEVHVKCNDELLHVGTIRAVKVEPPQGPPNAPGQPPPPASPPTGA
jgi:hypothetical protein